MTYYIHDTERAYRNWLFSPEAHLFVSKYGDSLMPFSAKLIRMPCDKSDLPVYAIEFPSEEHAMWFRLKYS